MRFTLAAVLIAILAAGPALADALQSWNEGKTKAAIVDFVNRVTDEGGPDHVAPSDRIAVFDNDGTLWAEKPMYFQIFFAFDKVAARAAADPSIVASDTLRAAAEGDVKAALSGGKQALVEIVGASHSDVTIEEFQDDVRDWLERARHPETGRRFDGMVYQPMLELLDYLRSNGFTTYIVSGGGVDFMRAFAEGAYGIPPSQVIGSMGAASYEIVDGKPVIRKDPALLFIDDKEGKPVGIMRHIGKRPILAAGNSDGDFQMLEWTTAGDGPRLGILVHHTDAEREWAYDREGHVGVLDRGLTEAPDRGWLLIDMAHDWAEVFPEAE